MQLARTFLDPPVHACHLRCYEICYPQGGPWSGISDTEAKPDLCFQFVEWNMASDNRGLEIGVVPGSQEARLKKNPHRIRQDAQAGSR